MEKIENHWADYHGEFTADNKEKAYYWYEQDSSDGDLTTDKSYWKEMLFDLIPYRMLNFAHNLLFNKSGLLAPACRTLASVLERSKKTWVLKRCLEDPVKVLFLSCQSCGDCAIQHVAFLCPETGCPKHTRNGPCGGSREGACEVYPEKQCIWVRAHERLKHAKRLSCFMQDRVPPRMWELNKTSAWANFHLGKDHQR